MPALVDQRPAAHLADFINTVSKLIAAVFGMNRSFRVRFISSVDIYNPRQNVRPIKRVFDCGWPELPCPLLVTNFRSVPLARIDAEGAQFPVQGGAFHADKFCRA